MLRKAIYPKIEGLLNTIGTALHAKGITPNQLTLGGLGLTFVAGLLFANGNFFLGGLVMLIAGSADMLDGPLARVGHKTTPFGAFLDSTVDRYADFFIFGGLALFYAKTGQGGWFLISLGIILGSFVTSYAKARAENLIADCSVGVFERSERILTLAAGIFLRPLLPLALWVLFFGTNATAIHRILHTRQTLNEKSL